ncbi:hypothetical protein GW17_00009840 [Ensete ventricosum]|nr:hypothetical protein GW17_00009840 [Ensete ventricosum]RZS08966.1 hypothetical protein BHM03_00040009 [Ensete ventricosum]
MRSRPRVQLFLFLVVFSLLLLSSIVHDERTIRTREASTAQPSFPTHFVTETFGATEANRAPRRSADGSTRAGRKDAMCSPGGGCVTTARTPCTRKLHALTCRTSWRVGSMAGRMRSTRGGDGSLTAAT